MKRLSGTDALFLSMETPSWHQHVAGLTILQPLDRPVTFEDIVRRVDERLDGAPKFRWRLQSMPFDLDRPVWVDDDDFDIRRHVHRMGVPAPGGARETAEIVGMIMSSQLDRRRPLWEMWVLEGLAHGRLALVLKYHHCLLDGLSGASLASILCDLEPDADQPIMPFPPEEERSAGAAPAPAEVMTRVALEASQRPFRWARYAMRGTQRLMAGAGFARREPEPVPFLGPVTPFNAPVGPRRAMSFVSVAMDDVLALKRLHDVKVNDLLLALVGGTLRRHLRDIEALPEDSLVSQVPVSTRAEGDATQDNQVSFMSVELATDTDDPVERLQRIHRSSGRAKAMRQAMSVKDIQSIGEVASPLALSTMLRTLHRTRLVSRLPRTVNTVVSNVPGPPMTVYSCGAEVLGIYPSSVIMESMGLNVTVFSYGGRIDFGFLVDPDLVPDPWAVSDLLPAELASLLEASGLGPATPVGDAFSAPADAGAA